MGEQIQKAEVGAREVAPSIESMMTLAVQQGPEGVEALERLVSLKERMEDRQAQKNFYQALAMFQDNVPEIPKNKTAKIATRKGGTYSYTFAPLEAITRTIREPLRMYGLSYSWDTEPSDNPNEIVVVCVLRHIDGHGERSRFPVPTSTDAAMSDAQKNGAALTYGRRQSLVAALGLTTADEDSGAPLRADTTKITDEQVADVYALGEEVGADMAKFFEYINVGSASDIPASRYEEVVRLLESKRK